jgi:hypothetical protein
VLSAERAVREYEAQFGKAWSDQEEKAKENQELVFLSNPFFWCVACCLLMHVQQIRKYREDLLEKSNEQKRLFESGIAKDRQIAALKEQHEFDTKQLRIAKQGTALALVVL